MAAIRDWSFPALNRSILNLPALLIERGRKKKGGVRVQGCAAILHGLHGAGRQGRGEKTRPEMQGSVTKVEANSTESATFLVIAVTGEGSA